MGGCLFYHSSFWLDSSSVILESSVRTSLELKKLGAELGSMWKDIRLFAGYIKLAYDKDYRQDRNIVP